MPVVILILLGLALLLWIAAQRARRASGLPVGRVVYSDTGGWARPEKPLFSQRLRLTGKPDYLVRHRSGYVPVEVKATTAPSTGPHAAHIYQLAAYCALAAEVYHYRPPYGLIKYANKTLAVDFTARLETELLRLLGQIRADIEADDVARSHQSAARCQACGFRDVCDQSLA